MRVYLSPENLDPYFKSQFKLIYKTIPIWVSDSDESEFSEHYCTESCKSKAWAEYYQLLSPSKWTEQISELYREIIKECNESSVVQPLIIIRMMCLALIKTKIEMKPIKEALEPFELFSPNQETTGLMDKSLNFLNELANHIFEDKSDLEEIINPKNYQAMAGVLSRNAVSLKPLSDFHLYISDLPDIHQSIIANIYQKGITAMDFIHSEWMQSLTVDGTGLFLIGNSINHSCNPNVASASCSNDHNLSLVSVRPIEAGEELLISYIDEELPYEERQAQLKKFYNFECKCPKCIEKL